ncbi:hypothetical protein BY996DRAFT_6546521 [Phakopsora pachyrhizi]|nr:hypothetical protein BY996DRAFT_6546521 [Phakopsora pachyrhizi]
MRERLKKKGREGKVEAFVKGLNSGSFDVVNYDYLTVSHKFTGGKLQDKVENKTINGKGYKFGAGGIDKKCFKLVKKSDLIPAAGDHCQRSEMVDNHNQF